MGRSHNITEPEGPEPTVEVNQWEKKGCHCTHHHCQQNGQAHLSLGHISNTEEGVVTYNVVQDLNIIDHEEIIW